MEESASTMVSAAWRIRADPGSNPGLTLLAFTPSSSMPSYRILHHTSLVRPHHLSWQGAGQEAVKQGEVGEVAPTGGRPRPRRAEETDVSLGRRVEERGLKRRKANDVRDMPRGAEGSTQLALRPLVLRRLPERMAVALRRQGGNEEEMSHLPGQDPPVEGNGVFAAFTPGRKQQLEFNNDTSSESYRSACRALAQIEEDIGADWDGVTVLENDRMPSVVMPDYIYHAAVRGDTKSVLKWINANRTEDRVNAVSSVEKMRMPILFAITRSDSLTLMTLLLQLGANTDSRSSNGLTAIEILFSDAMFELGDVSSRARLLLSWGATLIHDGAERRRCLNKAREWGYHKLADLLESELGGRRCEIVNHSSRPELNGKTCVVDEYLPGSNQYNVTLEMKRKDVLVLGPDNLKRRDRTPQDCGYYVEFKNGRTIRHDFDSNEDCQAFVAALNNNGETQPAVTEESEAAAELAAAELLAELGLGDSPSAPSSGCKTKKSKKKKGERRRGIELYFQVSNYV
ncbi:hypothetical protein THAOC_12077 [Thalassiosira oceanica]|uniref:Uncharacterized protein n=1 Tax=Thalassiosira oceanica TaxID=159749 RepID=K0SPL9_THAOC|nr:hypothetical protein THAOC_12077 [Thalassiosira oceanica]|eukprot:EJK66949.1 hypothetical protein THAOC_12077 [Thalassiosira oceanica]